MPLASKLKSAFMEEVVTAAFTFSSYLSGKGVSPSTSYDFM